MIAVCDVDELHNAEFNADVYSHHRTMTSCHMCNIALMTGDDLKWDPVKEEFIGNETANQLMSRQSRSNFLG